MKIQRDIFKGDALLSLVFLVAMIPLNYKLRWTGSNKFTKSHLCANNEKELEILIQIIRTDIQNIEMEFGIEKYAILIMKTNNRRNLTAKSRKNMNAWRKGKLLVQGNIRSGHHQTSRDERKMKTKEYLRQMRTFIVVKLCSRNLIKGLNT